MLSSLTHSDGVAGGAIRVELFYQLFPIAGGGHISMLTISRTPPRVQKKKATQEPISSQSQCCSIRASRAAVSTALRSAFGARDVLETTWLKRLRTTSHVASDRGFKGSGGLLLRMGRKHRARGWA